jgi:hypothetical protein
MEKKIENEKHITAIRIRRRRDERIFRHKLKEKTLENFIGIILKLNANKIPAYTKVN